MNPFESHYITHILPKYGNPLPKNLNNKVPHYLSIPYRTDLTFLPVYVIDPTGCTDSDDGFSIYYQDNKLFLAIYISDPTEHINPHSELWKSLVTRAITRYPSNHEPLHLMPESIVYQASLFTSLDAEFKSVLAFITEIDTTTYLPLSPPKILFATILVSHHRQYTYYDTTIDIYIKLGLKIGSALQNKRKSHGALIIDNPVTSISTQGNLRRDTKLTTDIKNMIAEFAIFVNTTVATTLISYPFLLQSNPSLGVSPYTQCTSPLRRISDCIVHYFLKSFLLHETPPFTVDEVRQFNEQSQRVIKADKKLSYEDHKFRFLEVIYNIIAKERSVTITLQYLNNTGPYLNFMITQINEYPVKIAYTSRQFDYSHFQFWITHSQVQLTLTHINPFKHYDSEIFPEITDFVTYPC